VLVRFDHVASVIINANYSIMMNWAHAPASLTQKQHRENVERERNRYRSLKRRKATVSG
jgi:hypothetical protein